MSSHRSKSKTITKNTKTTKTTKNTKKNASIHKKHNLDIISELFYQSNDSTSIINNICEFIKKNINNTKFINYTSNLTQNTNITLGRSGAGLNVLKNDMSKIAKYYYFTIDNNAIHKLCTYKTEANTHVIKDTKKDTKKDIHQCIFINNKINDILCHLIIKYINKFSNITTAETQLIHKHFLILDDYSISNSGTIIILPLVGINFIKTINKLQTPIYATNIKELITHNHNIILSTLLHNTNTNTNTKSTNQKILNLYDEFMAEHIESIYKVFRILQKHISFMHTDLKLANIFVKYDKCNNKKFNILRDYGFYIDFVLIVGDLEKSVYTLNNYKILPQRPHALKYMLLKTFTIPLHAYIQYECNTLKYDKVCSKITMHNFDLLLFIIDLFILYKHIDIDISSIFTNIKNIIKQNLTITESQFNMLLDMINKKEYINVDKISILTLSKIIAKYCKALSLE